MKKLLLLAFSCSAFSITTFAMEKTRLKRARGGELVQDTPSKEEERDYLHDPLLTYEGERKRADVDGARVGQDPFLGAIAEEAVTVEESVDRKRTRRGDLVKDNPSKELSDISPEEKPSQKRIKPSKKRDIKSFIAALTSEKIRRWVESGKKINAHQLLFDLAKYGKANCIKTLLACTKTDVNSRDKDGLTALHRAAKNGHADCVKALVSAGADKEALANGWTPLLFAVKCGQLACVETFLKLGANCQVRSKTGLTLVHIAVNNNKDDVLKALLNSQVRLDLEAKDGKGFTALHLAAGKGRSECLKTLLDAGADMDAKDVKKNVPLYWAAKKGNTECLKILLEKNAYVDAANADLDTPLYVASLSGKKDCVEILIEHGADIHAASNGRTALHAAAFFGHADCVEALLQKGADVQAKDEQGKTPLVMASMCGSNDCVKVLLENGAQDTNGNALWSACYRGHSETVALLLKHMPRDVLIALLAHEKLSPLLTALEKNQLDCFRLLLKKTPEDFVTKLLSLAIKGNRSEFIKSILECFAQRQTSITHKDFLIYACKVGALACLKVMLDCLGNEVLKTEKDFGEPTLLYTAAVYGHSEIVEELIKRGANPLIKNSDGERAFHAAARQGHKECLALLLKRMKKREINAKGRDKWAKYALFQAATNGHTECVSMLIEAGAQVDRAPKNGFTPLCGAIKAGYVGCIEVLLDKGAKIEANLHDGSTPLLYAVRCNQPSCFKLLLKRGANKDATDTEGRKIFDFAKKYKAYDVLPLLYEVNEASQENKSLRSLLVEGEKILVPAELFELSKMLSQVEGCPELGVSLSAWKLFNEHMDRIIEYCKLIKSYQAAGIDPNGKSYKKVKQELFECYKECTKDEIRELFLLNNELKMPLLHELFIELYIESLGKIIEHDIIKDYRLGVFGSIYSRLAGNTSDDLDYGLQGLVSSADPISSALKEGDLVQFAALLKKLKDKHIIGGLLRLAIYYGQAEFVTKILDHCKQHSISVYLKYHLLETCRKDDNTLLQIFLDYAGDEVLKGKELLFDAVKKGYGVLVKELIERGVDINSKDSSKQRPLHYAAQCGQKECLALLVKKTKTRMLNTPGADKKNALYQAVEHGHSECMALLIEAGAKISEDLLYVAIKCAGPKCLEVLLENEVNTDVVRDGFTPLTYAINLNRPYCFKLLLEKSANLQTNESFYRAAEECKAYDVLAVLQELDRVAEENQDTKLLLIGGTKVAVPAEFFEVSGTLKILSEDVEDFEFVPIPGVTNKTWNLFSEHLDKILEYCRLVKFYQSKGLSRENFTWRKVFRAKKQELGEYYADCTKDQICKLFELSNYLDLPLVPQVFIDLYISSMMEELDFFENDDQLLAKKAMSDLCWRKKEGKKAGVVDVSRIFREAQLRKTHDERL